MVVVEQTMVVGAQSLVEAPGIVVEVPGIVVEVPGIVVEQLVLGRELAQGMVEDKVEEQDMAEEPARGLVLGQALVELEEPFAFVDTVAFEESRQLASSAFDPWVGNHHHID